MQYGRKRHNIVAGWVEEAQNRCIPTCMIFLGPASPPPDPPIPGLHDMGAPCPAGLEPAAFANIHMQNGIASATAFVAFPHLGAPTIAAICLAASVLWLVCYHAAGMLHRRTIRLRV